MGAFFTCRDLSWRSENMSARPNKTSKAFPFHKKGTKSEYVTHPMFMPTTASAYESPFYSTAGAYENPYYPTGIPYNEVDCMTRSEMPFMPQPTAEMYPEMGPRYPMTAADYDPRGYPMTGAEYGTGLHPGRTDAGFYEHLIPLSEKGSLVKNGWKYFSSGSYPTGGVPRFLADTADCAAAAGVLYAGGRLATLPIDYMYSQSK